jgi:O-acetyl-ADP-ribose deacetylase
LVAWGTSDQTVIQGGIVRIELDTVDVTTMAVDAVVNAAHHAMCGGGGVDGAIHRRGGPEILAECVERFPDGLPTGEAGWTRAGDLPAAYVIHVVGPNWHAGQRDPALLESCYRNALRIADELEVRTMALPAVSAGIYGWPHDLAASIAVRTLATTPTGVERATFCLIEPRVYDAFARALAEVRSTIGEQQVRRPPGPPHS